MGLVQKNQATSDIFPESGGYLGIYNGHRCHMALGGLTPQQSLQGLLIAE
jgi:hypothetical protein